MVNVKYPVKSTQVVYKALFCTPFQTGGRLRRLIGCVGDKHYALISLFIKGLIYMRLGSWCNTRTRRCFGGHVRGEDDEKMRLHNEISKAIKL